MCQFLFTKFIHSFVWCILIWNLTADTQSHGNKNWLCYISDSLTTPHWSQGITKDVIEPACLKILVRHTKSMEWREIFTRKKSKDLGLSLMKTEVTHSDKTVCSLLYRYKPMEEHSALAHHPTTPCCRLLPQQPHQPRPSPIPQLLSRQHHWIFSESIQTTTMNVLTTPD